MNGLDLLAGCLEAAGVKFCVLAHPGMEPLEKSLSQKGIESLVPVSETASAMIADGYARASGKPGVVIAKRDLSKLVTGATSAWADKVPLIIVSICEDAAADFCPAFDRSGIDMKRLFKPITRFQARISRPEDIPELLIRAFRESVSFRGGPVFLEILESALEQPSAISDEQFAALKPRLKAAPEPVRSGGDPGLIEKAVKMLSDAARPMIFSGGGVIRSGASAKLNLLAEKIGIPIVSSMGGMGSADPACPTYIGPQSYLSGEAFHTAIREADVVLAVGAAFSGLDGFGLPPLWSEKIKFIQINIDPEHIAYNPPAELSILGDADLVVSQMLERAEKYSPPAGRKSWSEKLRRLNQEHKQRIIEESGMKLSKIHPALLVKELERMVEGDQTYCVVLDGGNTCLWVGMLLDVPGPGRSFFPTGMGTLGSGLPMAIGIKKAAGDARVILISGDGSFLYNIQEFETLRKYNIPLLVVVFNDSAWNMIRTAQLSLIGHIQGTDIPYTDYARAAQSYGCFGAKVTRKEDIEKAARAAMDSPFPAVVDFDIDPNCIPDSLNSFALVEMEGTNLKSTGMLRSILSGQVKFDLRLINQIRYILKSF